MWLKNVLALIKCVINILKDDFALMKPHLGQEVSQDVQRLSPLQRTFTHRDPLHRVRVHVLLLHLFYTQTTE